MGSVTHTLTSEGADASEDGGGRGTPVVTQGQQQVRRLTPRECERLQGFPDDWTAGQADSHRYKQLGNAVTVNVAHYVACLLNMALDSENAGAEHE
jgi:DNA (cytosine-5)-methyltransferase 1